LKLTLIVVAALMLVALAAFWLWTPDLKPAQLEAAYLRSPADRLELDGVRLHVRDDGPKAAPALIFVHGLGSSLHTWEPWAQALAAQFRVIRVDLPGSGLSPPDPTHDSSDARSLQLLLALMDRLELPRATLVGNSMGGRIAWSFAARHPQRVHKLVLVSPDGFESPGFEYDKAPQVPRLLQPMRWLLPRPLLRMNLAPAYADASKLTEPLLDRYHDLLRAPGARVAMLRRMQQTVLHDPVPQLRQIETPTLLLWGAQDAMIPLANSADYLKALPNSTLVTLDGIGHLPQEEDPRRSLPPLRAFLEP
jgi:pimeloyl-ACP methyl ester carboxylesterase